MKNTALILTLVGAVLAGGLASAQSSIFEQRALFEVPNVMAEVTFYDGDPSDGGVMLAEARINNSPFAQVISGIENTEYLTLEIDGRTYTVNTFPGGTSKHSVFLNVNGLERENAVTLAELLDDIAVNPSAVAQLNEPSLVRAEFLTAR